MIALAPARSRLGAQALVVPILLLALLAGCARAPTLRSVLKDKYPGYDQILPTSTVSLTDAAFDYTPGTILAVIRQEPATWTQAAVWSSEGVYCPPGFSLSAVRLVRRAPVNVTYDFDLSLRRALHAQKAKADLQLEENEIETLRRVTIRIDSPRSFSLHGGRPVPHYLAACLSAIAGHPGLKKISSIIVGNVQVTLLFKNDVSLVAKFALMNKVQGAMGFGYVRGESYSLSADDVVFGARLVELRH
jgi:hypothetical protein